MNLFHSHVGLDLLQDESVPPSTPAVEDVGADLAAIPVRPLLEEYVGRARLRTVRGWQVWLQMGYEVGVLCRRRHYGLLRCSGYAQLEPGRYGLAGLVTG